MPLQCANCSQSVFAMIANADGRLDDGGVMGPQNFINNFDQTVCVKQGVEMKDDYLRMCVFLSDLGNLKHHHLRNGTI